MSVLDDDPVRIGNRYRVGERIGVGAMGWCGGPLTSCWAAWSR